VSTLVDTILPITKKGQTPFPAERDLTPITTPITSGQVSRSTALAHGLELTSCRNLLLMVGADRWSARALAPVLLW